MNMLACSCFLFFKNIHTIGMSLDSFLIEPVQRIPRYCMLLNELLKNTDELHPDFENIHTCVTNVCCIRMYGYYITILLCDIQRMHDEYVLCFSRYKRSLQRITKLSENKKKYTKYTR